MFWNWDTTAVIFLILMARRTVSENTTLVDVDIEEETDYSEVDFDTSVSNLDELEKKLLEPVEDKRSRFGLGWSSWSEWSTCSRTCDGGASYQLRRCNSPTGCRGESIRYKICNMQPCPEQRDFRIQQCSAYNDIPYQENLYHWEPYYDEGEPCALACRAAGNGESFVVQLAAKVQDGTRCRPGSLDMCINGKCQLVGCDLKIGSTKRVDECGVCGGDGSTCAQPLYHWEEAAMSLCSRTCGGGYKMSRPVCRNRISGEEADEQLCNLSQMPSPKTIICNTHRCPPRWVIDDWGPCSVSCGGGSRFRHIHCMEEGNGTKEEVPEHLCRGHKPRYQEPCNTMDCPRWYPGDWSGCSVSCGEGFQTRSVICRDARGHPSILCNKKERPVITQICRTGIECPVYKLFDEDGEQEEPEQLPGRDHTQPLVQPPPPEHHLAGEQLVQHEASFITEEWGPCSVTCGEGIRKRNVTCKIFLEFSRTIATMPDSECPGPKPPEIELCSMPCPLISSLEPIRDGYQEIYANRHLSNPNNFEYRHQSKFRDSSSHRTDGEKYVWKEIGYTSCSASCLGGVQESIVSCIRERDQKTSSPYQCDLKKKPDVITRTCNDHPCPPRWNYSDFQPCSKPCGIGIQIREVNCIHEVTRGGGNTMIIPSNRCPQPSPPDRQQCNVLDCSPKWTTGNWQKCSKSCGGGIKYRQVECKQTLAQGHIVSRDSSECAAEKKPAESKPCNTKPCEENERPHIAVINQTYIQQSPMNKVTLKIGGQAVVFRGTQVKIKCPVKRFNRTKIAWSVDQRQISPSKKYKISKKGALRIQDITYKDSGVYTCSAGRSSANLTLTVKPMPGHFPTSEEIDRNTDRNLPHANHVGQQSFAIIEDPTNDNSAQNLGSYSRGKPTPYRAPNQLNRKPSPLFSPPDQSHEMEINNKHQKNPGNNGVTKHHHEQERGRNQQPDTNYRPRQYDSSEEVNENSVVVKNNIGGLEGLHIGSTLVSDQEQGSSPSPSTSHPNDRDSDGPRIFQFGDDFSSSPPSSSGGSRPMPHFQMLLAKLQNLWPFQAFGSSRGHRMVTKEMEEAHDDATTHTTPGTIILGKGKRENITFEWVISKWSDCTTTCGGGGIQMRGVYCVIIVNNHTTKVENHFCEDKGLPAPATTQTCGLSACPYWSAGPWPSCEESRCFNYNAALQRREVTCQLPNGTQVIPSMCSEKEKPPQRQECYNDKCKGTWKVGEWSEKTLTFMHQCENNSLKTF